MPQDCLSCSTRSWYLRMPYDSEEAAEIDTTNHLVPIGNGVFACPSCGVLIRREYEPATMFHDYDGYTFERLPDAPLTADALAEARRKAGIS